MAPPSADGDIASSSGLPQHLKDHTKTTFSSFPKPLKYSGLLDEYENFDVTSVIGREFPKLQLSEILEDDAKIRDLAIIGEINLTFLLRILS